MFAQLSLQSKQFNNEVIERLWRAIAVNVDERDEYGDEKDSKSGQDEVYEAHDDDDDGSVCGGCEDDAEEEDNDEDDDEEEDGGEEADICDVDRPTKFPRTDHAKDKGRGKGAKGQGNGRGSCSVRTL